MSFASYCNWLCPIQWSQVLSREWRCSWSSADRRCSNYIWVVDYFIAYQSASYIRDFTVLVFVMGIATQRVVDDAGLCGFLCCQLNTLLIKVKSSVTSFTMFLPEGPLDNNPSLGQKMTWRGTWNNQSLSEAIIAYDADAFMRHSTSVT